MTIHGLRMPSGDEVRSLILPKNGLPNMATRAPIPATSARLFGACLIPTSELTFNAKVTSRGARNTREVLMYARVYSEMNTHPTRCAAGTQAPAQPRLRSGTSIRPARRWEADAGGRRGAALGTGNVGHRALLKAARSQATNGRRKRALPARVLTGYG